MKRSLTAIAVVAMMTGVALAQATNEHQQHHPGGAAPQAQPAPAPHRRRRLAQGQMPMGQTMQSMPDQCRSMMQNMQTCMGTMQQMMHGRMGGAAGGGMMGGAWDSRAARPCPECPHKPCHHQPATKAYLDAAERMHAPMMEGVQASDPDVAFVRGMIPHHQAAIDMAKVVLQYGKDAQTRKWAEDVIREQQREINEMQEWLKKNMH